MGPCLIAKRVTRVGPSRTEPPNLQQPAPDGGSGLLSCRPDRAEKEHRMNRSAKSEPSSIKRRHEAAAQRATRLMWINIAVALGGFWLSLATLVAAGFDDFGVTSVALWGAVILGIWFGIKNGIALSKAEAGLRSLAAADRPDVLRPSITRPAGAASQAARPPTRAGKI